MTLNHCSRRPRSALPSLMATTLPVEPTHESNDLGWLCVREAAVSTHHNHTTIAVGVGRKEGLHNKCLLSRRPLLRSRRPRHRGLPLIKFMVHQMPDRTHALFIYIGTSSNLSPQIARMAHSSTGIIDVFRRHRVNVQLSTA
jgi:hypothetical protein